MKVLDNKQVYVFQETIKKSKFITYIGYINSKEDLNNFINKYSKPDARHNCWAYQYGVDDIKYGYNNDGEPTGTAGEPLLKLIQINDLTNIIIFCVRYYGGIKLGTGGLQRAYSNGAIDLLKQITSRELILTNKVSIVFNIASIKLVNNFVHLNKIDLLNSIFDNDNVSYEFLLFDLNLLNSINKLIIERTIANGYY
ncbi:IMPACT family protein [Spiroplasma culicicola]|uniref:Impact N-terminal domain-containing protein n=1 Tax=Spiroplasma culicicola AES-1 TaxID=1276246 RepID=W6A6D2_9MOLU|nr:YigZ family protein [Spiroplasma culicicola]AHI52405.1 hypothetical protein SCULI_v1c00640 [Spiroplasma culicicola AES-1]